jgi:hypothetical protein
MTTSYKIAATKVSWTVRDVTDANADTTTYSIGAQGVVETGFTFGAGTTQLVCRWSPPLLVYPRDLRPGMSWESRSDCEGTLNIRAVDRIRIVGTSVARLGSSRDPTACVEMKRTRDTFGAAPVSLGRTSCYAPSLGFSARYTADGRTFSLRGIDGAGAETDERPHPGAEEH